MEENLDLNNRDNKEISDNTTKSNSEEIKESRSEKDINNGDSVSKVSIKNEILINFPILTSRTFHLKYLNEVF